MEEEEVKILSPEPFPLRKNDLQNDFSDDSRDNQSINVINLPETVFKLKQSSSTEKEKTKKNPININKRENNTQDINLIKVSEKREKSGLEEEENLTFPKKKISNKLFKNFKDVENLTNEKKATSFLPPKIPVIRNGKIPKYKNDKKTMMMTNFFEPEEKKEQSPLSLQQKKIEKKPSSKEKQINQPKVLEEKSIKNLIAPSSSAQKMNNNLSLVKKKNLPTNFIDSMTVELLDQRKINKKNETEIKDEELMAFLQKNKDKIPSQPSSRIVSQQRTISQKKIMSQKQALEQTSQQNQKLLSQISGNERISSSKNSQSSKNESQKKDQQLPQITHSQKKNLSSRQNSLKSQQQEHLKKEEEIENEEINDEEIENNNQENIEEGNEEGSEDENEEELLTENESKNSSSRKRKNSTTSSTDEEKELERMREKKKYLEDIQSRLAEQEKREKKELIYEFWKMEKNGIPVSKKWTQEDNIFEMRFEYHKLKSETDLKEKVKFIWNIFTMFNGIAQLANEKLNPFGISMDGWTDTLEQEKNDYETLLRKMYKQISYKWSLKPHVQFLMMFGGQFISFIAPRILKKFGEDKNAEVKNQKTIKESKEQDDIEQLKKKMEEMSSIMVNIVSQMENQQTKNLEIQMQMLNCLSQISNNLGSYNAPKSGKNSIVSSPLKTSSTIVKTEEKQSNPNPLNLKITPIDIIPTVIETTKKLETDNVTSSVKKGLKIPSYPIEPLEKKTNLGQEDVGHLLNLFEKFSKQKNQTEETPKELREYDSEPEKPDHINIHNSKIVPITENKDNNISRVQTTQTNTTWNID
jgi:hypothetical protein